MCGSKAIAHEVSFDLAEPMPKKPAKAESQHHFYFGEERLKRTVSHLGNPKKQFHKQCLSKDTLLDAQLFFLILDLVNVVGKPGITKS